MTLHRAAFTSLSFLSLFSLCEFLGLFLSFTTFTLEVWLLDFFFSSCPSLCVCFGFVMIDPLVQILRRNATGAFLSHPTGLIKNVIYFGKVNLDCLAKSICQAAAVYSLL